LAKVADTFKDVDRVLYKNYPKHEGDHIPIVDNETGSTYYGRIKIKAVRCGKAGCTKCPHYQYAYAQYRVGKKVKEKYLGIAR